VSGGGGGGGSNYKLVKRLPQGPAFLIILKIKIYFKAVHFPSILFYVRAIYTLQDFSK
jgi:hypothetical protein